MDLINQWTLVNSGAPEDTVLRLIYVKTVLLIYVNDIHNTIQRCKMNHSASGSNFFHTNMLVKI